MEKNKKIKLIWGLVIGLVGLVGALAFYILTLPAIAFNNETPTVEINETFEPLSIVEKVRKDTIDDIVVNVDALDVNTLGTYVVTYTLGEEVFEIPVSVVDTVAPTFDAVDGETDATIAVDPATLVSNIVDATNTTVSFKEEYSFDTEGTFDFVVVVKDEGNNVTEKTIKMNILPKDETAPVISGKESMTLYINSTIDEMDGMSVKDNQDPNPKLTVVSNSVNNKKAGTYKIVYEAVDRSGNKATFTRTITIKNEKKTEYTGEKVVYLTFDDGPSYNTKKVLDILAKYDIKATFFVTGNGSTHNQYIKEVYDAGHTLALHTYSHNYSQVYASVDAYFADLKKIDDLVYSLTGYHSPYVRFPGGSSNTVSRNYSKGIMSKLAVELHNRGYEYYDWNVSSADASGQNVSVDTIIRSSTSVSNGTVMLLFHDTYGKDSTVKALPTIIEYYQDLGYTFKGIDENTYGFHHGINN